MKYSCLERTGHQIVAGDGRSGKFGVIGHENFETCYLQVNAPDECKIEWKISTDVEFHMEDGDENCDYDYVYLEWDSPIFAFFNNFSDNGENTFEHHETPLFCDNGLNKTLDYFDWTATNHNVLTAHHKADSIIYNGQWEVDWRCSNGKFFRSVFIVIIYCHS